MRFGSSDAVHSSQGSDGHSPQNEPDPLGEAPMDHPPFRYTPKCSTLGCGRPGLFKVAAPWSYGNINELKNYGVCCEEHRASLHNRARAESAKLYVAEGEGVGPVGVYPILPGARDADLAPIG
jgi:hypothetical protein